jgi:predicted dienelactone hydrolase
MQRVRRPPFLVTALLFAFGALARAQVPAPAPPPVPPPAPPPVKEASAQLVAAPPTWKEARGPHEIESFSEVWRDEERSRDVPVKLWSPKIEGKAPVVIFSHGLGGTRDNYAHHGQHWSSHGYVVVHLQHLGSDDGVWRGASRPMEAMQKAVADVENLLARPRDVGFAIDELARRAAREDWPLAGRLALDSIAVAGHSFGAYTALCAAGRDLVLPGGGKLEVSDPRVKACIAMSPQGNERERSNASWSEFACPVLHMTGTKDTSPIRGDSKPAERRIPFDTIDRADQYLLILEGAEHSAFGDTLRGFGRRDPAHEPLIFASSTAFLDAYLRADAKALAWLRDGGFAARLGAHGTFETKRPRSSAVPADDTE